MSTTKTNASVAGYGYASDEQKISPFNFGGNFGVTRLKKFEWIPNGGKDGAEQEALDIVFEINGTEKNYRMFPVVKAFDKNNQEVTDPTAPEMQDAMIDFNARITHILHAFLDADTIKAGFARPIANFKEFCQIAMSLLPKNFNEKPLDIFMQYQWNLKEGQERTYLDIPNKMKQGKWLCAAVPGKWTKNIVENPSDDVKKALWYTNEEGAEHPFFKNGWFMNSNYAKQQTTQGAGTSESNTAATIAEDGQKKAATW